MSDLVAKLYKIELSVSGAGASAALCRLLGDWGYACSVQRDDAVERVTASGAGPLAMERFQELVATIATLGGAIYGFRMAEEERT